MTEDDIRSHHILASNVRDIRLCARRLEQAAQKWEHDSAITDFELVKDAPHAW